MVPINYESKNVWDAMTNIILLPASDESRQFFSEVNNYKLGQSQDSKSGYQYLLGKNVPLIYESVEVTKSVKPNPRRRLNFNEVAEEGPNTEHNS